MSEKPLQPLTQKGSDLAFKRLLTSRVHRIASHYVSFEVHEANYTSEPQRYIFGVPRPIVVLWKIFTTQMKRVGWNCTDRATSSSLPPSGNHGT